MNCNMTEGSSQIVDRLLEIVDKDRAIMGLYERWVNLKTRSGGVFEFIRDNEFERVAVYGMGSLGRSLCDELIYNGIELAYIVDQNKNVRYGEYACYTMQDELPEADVIIVTPISFFEEIQAELAKKVICPLLSLDDIIP